MKTHKLAAIDIGSNSLKLVITEAAASDSFTVLLQERERVRLGHETLKNKFLSDEAIELSAGAISRFRSIADSREVDSIIAVATASVREAKNSAQFVKEIHERTGVKVEILPSIEEARLIGIAVAQNMGFEGDGSSLLNIDIGGGSTELSLMSGGEPYKLFSLKLGAVGLTEKFILSDPPKKKEIKKLKREIKFALERPLRKIEGEKWQLSTGSSGTILRLASLLNFQAGGSLEEFSDVKLKKLNAFNKKLRKTTYEERAVMPGVSPQRAEVIIAGGLILEGVMKALNIKTLKPCTYALREGVIIDYLREIEAESLPPVPDVEDIRLRDIFAIGRRYGYEEKHALQVANLAEKIFDQLAPAYDFTRQDRTLLAAAALLHNVGYHISHESHHKHSYYLIKHSEITGFSENEKAIIANIARYHRKALPKSKHIEYMQLAESDRKKVAKLGGILRLADALDRGYENHVKNVKFNFQKDKIHLKLVSNKDCRIEIEAVETKKDLFEYAFDCELIAVEENTLAQASVNS